MAGGDPGFKISEREEHHVKFEASTCKEGPSSKETKLSKNHFRLILSKKPRIGHRCSLLVLPKAQILWEPAPAKGNEITTSILRRESWRKHLTVFFCGQGFCDAKKTSSACGNFMSEDEINWVGLFWVSGIPLARVGVPPNLVWIHRLRHIWGVIKQKAAGSDLSFHFFASMDYADYETCHVAVGAVAFVCIKALLPFTSLSSTSEYVLRDTTFIHVFFHVW